MESNQMLVFFCAWSQDWMHIWCVVSVLFSAVGSYPAPTRLSSNAGSAPPANAAQALPLTVSLPSLQQITWLMKACTALPYALFALYIGHLLMLLLLWLFMQPCRSHTLRAGVNACMRRLVRPRVLCWLPSSDMGQVHTWIQTFARSEQERSDLSKTIWMKYWGVCYVMAAL